MIESIRNLFYTHTNLIKAIESKCVLRAIDINKKVSYLDIGCASGRQFLNFGKRCRFSVGIDLNEESLKSAKNLIEMRGDNSSMYVLKSDGAAMPFKDNFYDRILCADVISIVENPLCVLKEAIRIVNNSGKIIICNGRSYKTIDFFYNSQNLIMRGLRSLLVKTNILPSSSLEFYRKRTSRNLPLNDSEFQSRYANIDLFLEEAINKAGGLIQEKHNVFCGLNEFLISLINLCACACRIPSRLIKYLTAVFIPLFQFIEWALPFGKGLAVIYVIKKR